MALSEIQDLNESRSLVGQNDPTEEEESTEDAISIEDLMEVDALVLLHDTTRLWKSIYSHFGDMDVSEIGHYGEPPFTNYASQFQGTLDYLFIEKQESHVAIQSLLMLPKEEHLKPSLPNKNFGSDHLCLVANLEFS